MVSGALFIGPLSFATSYRLSNINTLSRFSGVACFGKVLQMQPGEFNKLPVTEVRFQCEKPAKGKEGVYLFRVLNLSNSSGNLRFISPGFHAAVSFVEGKKYFVFFHAPHPVTGLTSPVSGSQGVFRYEARVGLVNDLQNENLFRGILAEEATQLSPSLRATMRSIQEEKRMGLSIDEMIRFVQSAPKEEKK